MQSSTIFFFWECGCLCPKFKIQWWTWTTILWAQQTVRSSCWSSMYNGIRPEPTDKRFNSAYLEIKYLILRKIHSTTFLTRQKSPWCLRRKDFFETKTLEWDFHLGTPPPIILIGKIRFLYDDVPSRLYGRSRQCSCPVGARCSMGLGRNQLINGLNQHIFKLNILFIKKFTVIPFD